MYPSLSEPFLVKPFFALWINVAMTRFDVSLSELGEHDIMFSQS